MATTGSHKADDVKQCGICNGVVKQPKSLSCLHSFCLECLEALCKTSTGSNNPTSLKCPTCRTETNIPSGGIAALLTDYFLEKLAVSEKISKLDPASITCDLCATRASIHCFACKQNLCDQCKSAHAILAATKDHGLAPIGRAWSGVELRQMEVNTNLCSEHTKEHLKMYCQECKILVCLVCCAVEHKTHNCVYTEKLKEDFSNQLDSDMDMVDKHIETGLSEVRYLNRELSNFLDATGNEEEVIKKRSAEMITLIEKHTKELLDKIQAAKIKSARDTGVLIDDVEEKVRILKSYANYAKEMKDKGTDMEIANASAALHTRAEELMKFDVTPSLKKLNEVTMDFEPTNISKLLAGNTISLVGTITIKEIKPVPLKLVIPKGLQVRGITTIKEELFVARKRHPDIEVYKVPEYTLLRNITVPGLSACDMTSCSSTGHLYITDFHAMVNVVDVEAFRANPQKTAVKWSTTDKPDGISMNDKGNVVVAFREVGKIREFTTAGALIRCIDVQPLSTNGGVPSVRYAIQLKSLNQFLICCGQQQPFHLLVVDVAGKPIRRLIQDSREIQHATHHLSIDFEGFVYMADFSNNRLLKVNQKLEDLKECVAANGGLAKPFRLHLDERHGYLYIGEFESSGRVWANRVATHI